MFPWSCCRNHAALQPVHAPTHDLAGSGTKQQLLKAQQQPNGNYASVERAALVTTMTWLIEAVDTQSYSHKLQNSGVALENNGRRPCDAGREDHPMLLESFETSCLPRAFFDTSVVILSGCTLTWISGCLSAHLGPLPRPTPSRHSVHRRPPR